MTKKAKVQKVAYYEEDYVEKRIIKETPSLPQVKIKFKPLNMIQTSHLTDAVMDGKSVAGATLATLNMLTKHIVEWDLQKPSGEVIDFTRVEELKKVDPTVINKIAGMVRGDKKGPLGDIKAIKSELKNLSGEQDSI